MSWGELEGLVGLGCWIAIGTLHMIVGMCLLGYPVDVHCAVPPPPRPPVTTMVMAILVVVGTVSLGVLGNWTMGKGRMCQKIITITYLLLKVKTLAELCFAISLPPMSDVCSSLFLHPRSFLIHSFNTTGRNGWYCIYILIILVYPYLTISPDLG